jgi:hypothetical protein
VAWVKLDDRMPEHPKVLPTGPLGLALQVRAIAYCNRNRTDGFLSMGAALREVADFAQFGIVPAEMFATMVRARLWHEVQGGFQVHDFHDYQPTSAEIAGADAGRASQRSNGGKARAATGKRGKGGRFSSNAPAADQHPPASHQQSLDQHRPASPAPGPGPHKTERENAGARDSQRLTGLGGNIAAAQAEAQDIRVAALGPAGRLADAETRRWRSVACEYDSRGEVGFLLTLWRNFHADRWALENGCPLDVFLKAPSKYAKPLPALLTPTRPRDPEGAARRSLGSSAWQPGTCACSHAETRHDFTADVGAPCRECGCLDYAASGQRTAVRS